MDTAHRALSKLKKVEEDTRKGPPYIMLDPKNKESEEPQFLTSTKQIQLESAKILEEWSVKEKSPDIWNFKELLTWKVPDYLMSTSARESLVKLKRKQEHYGYVCSYA